MMRQRLYLLLATAALLGSIGLSRVAALETSSQEEPHSTEQTWETEPSVVVTTQEMVSSSEIDPTTVANVTQTTQATTAVTSTKSTIAEPTETPTTSQPQARQEGIIKTDEQFLIKNPLLDPYRKVVHLESFFPTGPLNATGVLIGPDLVLTAAHNVYSLQEQKWTQEVVVTPAKNGEEKPYGSYKANRIFMLKAYQHEMVGTADSNDMAVIQLTEPVDRRVGFLSVRSQQSQGERIQVAGYPVESAEKLGFQYSMFGTITSLNQKLIEYTIDTESGQSGAPVLNQNQEVIAIHTLGFVDHNQQYIYNSARRVMQDSLDMIAFAKKELTKNDTVAAHWMVELPVYRFYHRGIKRHLYTQDPNEIDHLKKIGWSYEHEKFRTTDNGQPVYRLYSSITKEHLYTTSSNEKNVLVTRGWRYENVAWYSQGDTPVYRLYHSGLKVHLYTSDKNERKILLQRGWKDEKIAWYAL